MHLPSPEFTRRSMIGALAAAGGLTAVGCKPSGTEQPRQSRTAPGQAPNAPVQAAAMTVYRDPGCGCCEDWAKLAQQAGYELTLVDRTDMPAIKQKYGVPEPLGACHTAVVGNYVIEGHVPFEDVKRLLAERPADIRGIAVAGMPIGSPGMEVPGATKEPFQVMAFEDSGRTFLFRS